MSAVVCIAPTARFPFASKARPDSVWAAWASPAPPSSATAPASDDVGYLNIGADIIVKGDATNGVCNAMAQGRVMIGGSIGSRGLTMTKWNPEYQRPELWVLGSVGDTFAEFNCGGIAVVCGIEAKKPTNVLGYRPCVGMVGGWIYYRGATDATYSKNNAKLIKPDDAAVAVAAGAAARLPGGHRSQGTSQDPFRS